MNILFFVAVGVLSAAVSTAFGYDISDVQYWAISLPMIIVLNALWVAK